MTYKEIKQLFKAHEQSCPNQHLTAYITFSAFGVGNQTEYPWVSRTYEISSDNKAFQPSMGGCSIFGRCLDGKHDPCIRLENYIFEERGGKDSWKEEECCLVGYLLSGCSDCDIPTSELFYEYGEAHSHMLAQLAQTGDLDAAELEKAYRENLCAFKEDHYKIEGACAWLSDQAAMDWHWSIQTVRIYSPTRIVVGNG